jgi:hypothetical protein
MHTSDRKAVSAPVRLQTHLNPKRQLFRTSATSNTPQPEKAVIPHQRNFKPASARKGSYSAPQRPSRTPQIERRCFRTNATSIGDNHFQSCSYKTRPNKKHKQSGVNSFQSYSYTIRPNRSAKRAVLNHHGPSCRPHMCFTARRQPRPGPTAHCSRRRCAARNLVLFSQPSRAATCLAPSGLQRRS